MERQKLIEILSRHASDQFGAREEAESAASHMGRCGSPFTYEVIEAEPDNFLVVTHIEASLYRELMEASRG